MLARAFFKFSKVDLAVGSFIISPLNTESSKELGTSQSLVIHLELDPCGWLPHMFGVTAAYYMPLLARVAGELHANAMSSLSFTADRK
jgi:hypothetical protein